MAGDTNTMIIGNLTDDPRIHYTAQGDAIATFTVASTPRSFDKASGQWKDGEALFMRCSLWRQPAENLVESLSRGDRVVVAGRLRQRTFEKDGQKRSVIELDVEEVGPSLRYATAKVVKAARGSDTGGQDSWAAGKASSAPADDGAPF